MSNQEVYYTGNFRQRLYSELGSLYYLCFRCDINGTGNRSL